MISVEYDKGKDVIIGAFNENFGRICEEDVTKQVLDAAFECLLSKGLATIAEHCEYELNGVNFRVSVVKDKEPVIDSVKRGRWINDGDRFICSNCWKAYGFPSSKCLTNYCPNCGADMRGESK